MSPFLYRFLWFGYLKLINLRMQIIFKVLNKKTELKIANNPKTEEKFRMKD